MKLPKLNLTFSAKRKLQRAGLISAIVIMVLILIWFCWVVWLERYVVYSRDGAKLDFSISNQQLSGQVAQPPANDATVSIYYNEGDNTLNISTELTQLAGFYIDSEMLISRMPEMLDMVKKLPAQTPVMIDVKDIVGRFYYSTALGPVNTSIDQASMNALIEYLVKSDLYVIARAPALRDYYYGLDHVSDGLPMRGGYLWMDDDRCYWLNPKSEGTLTRLIQTAKELREKGFNEVLFSDFRFPETDKIVFSGSRTEALEAAASRLLESCATERFAVSFLVDSATFPLPEGRTRMYMEGVGASKLKTLAEESGLEDPAVKLAFVTDVNDTRFDAYGVLRPLTSAQFEE